MQKTSKKPVFFDELSRFYVIKGLSDNFVNKDFAQLLTYRQ